MAPQLNEQAQSILKSIIDNNTDSPNLKIANVSVAITNANGDDLFTYAAGHTDATGETKLTEENLFWAASTTKLIVAVAALQLVEQGKLRLDDSNQVETLVPEIANLPIATKNEDGSLKLTPKKNGITLRHLLTHTAGFGYGFFNEIYNDWNELFKLNEFDIQSEREIRYPLLFEPGTDWNYGLSIDWAGVVIERVTGQKLGEYIEANILKPLGIEDTTFEPTAEQKKRLAQISLRDGKTGVNTVIEHTYFGGKNPGFHSGGAGLVTRPHEYIKFLATLLNNGISSSTNNRILKKETVDLIFENQIPQFPDFGRKGIKSPVPTTSNDIPDIYPEAGNPPQGWGLSLFLFSQPGQTGHAAGTGFWAGITNSYYWIDRETGVAGYISGATLPFADPQILKNWFEIETVVYKSLSAKEEPSIADGVQSLKITGSL